MRALALGLALMSCASVSRGARSAVYQRDLDRCVNVSHTFAEYEACAKEADRKNGVRP